MGIHHWSKSAVLTLLVVLSIGHAHAATRKQVSMPSDGQVIGSGNGSSKAGSRISVPGNPIEGEYIPSSYGGGSKGTKLPIKPTYDYSIPRTVKGMVGNLRGGVYGAAVGIGLQYMLDAVDGVIEDGRVVIRTPQDVPGGIYWYYSNQTTVHHTSAVAACQYAASRLTSQGDTYIPGTLNATVISQAGTSAQCQMTSYTGIKVNGTAYRVGNQCPDGSEYNVSTGACVSLSGTRPATDADYDLMEAAAAAKDSEWLKERLREHCEGSLNPQGCYEELRDNTWLEGPASVTEPGPTTTTTSPAGTTTSTTNARYDITYGDNYYDYRTTKTTTVTKPDGSTETTTETEPETEQPREEEEQDINFTDSEFPPVEPFYQQKYPEGLEGVWQDAQSKFDNSEFISFLHSFVPQFSGSCPSWSMSFNIANWASYGNVPFVNLCYVFDFIKVIMLVTALFTARAITFGG